MEAAARSAGRRPEDIRLLVASKTAPVEKILEAHAAGACVFGENRVQEAVDKIDRTGGMGLHWHFIGHLQKNKVRQIVGRVECIHSVDSLALAEAIDKTVQKTGQGPIDVLIEVNVSGETSKFGVPPEALEETLRTVARCSGLRVRGLMTIPPFDPDPERSRPFFIRLRGLRDRAADIPGICLDELSMGMTNDFEVAIEEGATWVRVGTAIFGERPG